MTALGSWVGHVLGLDEGVEFFGGDVAELDGGFAETDLGMMRGFRDLRGVVVTNLGSEGGDEHQRIVDVAIDLFAVGLDAADAIDRKSTRLNSSHTVISYAVFCLKKKHDNGD